MKNILKYLEDPLFIQWVFNPGQETEERRILFENASMVEMENIQQARKILQKLHTVDKELSESEKITIFTQILKQVENQQRKGKARKIFISLMKYAAVAIVFFASGALLFYQKNNFNPELLSPEIPELTFSDAILIRPGGEDIILSEKNSRIEHRQDGQLVINEHLQEAASPGTNRVTEINQLVIPYGKTSEIILPDETKVWLNAGSRLIYPEVFKDKTREVLLVGEAYFEVAHQENRPFIVQTTDIRIQVLGTKFNVSAYPSDNIIETALAEGRVKLEQKNAGFFSESVEVNPGQLASFNKTEGITRLKEVDTDNYIFWKDGLLKFESTDLSRIAKRLERYYNIHFKYANPFLGGIKISGKLELNESRETILDNIATVASVKINKVGEGYYEIKR